MKHQEAWDAIRDMWRVSPDWSDSVEARISSALDGIASTERDECVKIVVLGSKEKWTPEMVIDEIRARSKTPT